ncbi:helix-turn-helix domain-containing protein [Thalassotalea sediminis]|uniref:helix-turn-helix domain-containing protein n=1 Tax=Thalassotalea sediminis TaxID=1759089 RepID=UPI00257343A5|nr:helix-turn-helix transcriptional regulator [Thalassotalea sediminis]
MISPDIIKNLRSQHGWTQEQLATISGVSSRTIQRIEKTGECSLESKMAIAAAFNVTPKFLVNESNYTENNYVISPRLNVISWVLLLTMLLAILLVPDGELQVRLHINGVVMMFTLFALSIRVIDIKELKFLLIYSLGGGKLDNSKPLIQLISSLNQLIRFTYISAIFAFLFHGWQMSFAWPEVSLFSARFSELMANSIIASVLYSVVVAELFFRTSKLRLESQLIKDNALLDKISE